MAKDDGVLIYAVGVGPESLRIELQQIASQPHDRHMVRVNDFDAIEAIRSSLRRFICIDSICPRLEQSESEKNSYVG